MTRAHPQHAKTILRKRKTVTGYLQHLDEIVRHAQKSYAPLEGSMPDARDTARQARTRATD